MASSDKLVAIGNYKLQQIRLGEGSFATVELAKHVILQQSVALKILHRNSIKDPYVLKNLEREALVLSRLKHPSIIRLIEVCSADTIYCLVLQYVPGALSLYDVLEQRGVLREEEARPVLSQLVDGLLYMHQRSVIHRDIKLENLLVDPALQRCIIIDFGLSNLWFPGKFMNTHCGSTEYAAPELFIQGANYGPGVDTWSFGVVLYASLLGTLPFQQTSSQVLQEEDHHIIRKIHKGLTSAHHRQINSLSIDCRVLLLRCLDVNPATRISMATVCLDPWIQGCKAHADSNKAQLNEDSLYPDVAADMKGRLRLTISPDDILSHVKSRPLGTTGGCFNLLLLEHLELAKAEADGCADSVPASRPARALTTLARIENLLVPRELPPALNKVVEPPKQDPEPRAATVQPSIGGVRGGSTRAAAAAHRPPRRSNMKNLR